MEYNNHNTRIKARETVPSPNKLIDEIGVPDDVGRLVYESRHDIGKALHGEGRQPLLCVVGPCSIHDAEAAQEYAEKLQPLARDLHESLLIVMRVYFEKPRTRVGWKGLINDPHMDDSFDINEGLRTARTVLKTISSLGLPCGTEWLDPISPQYLGDFVSWGVIGARTTESQIHRQLASGLSSPVGFKNSTNGDIKVAVDAVKSAAHEHVFLSVTREGDSAIFSTTGNNDCHIILRGSSSGPNYDRASVVAASKQLSTAGLPARVMVDCSHANSQKQHRKQLTVCRDLCEQLRDPTGSPVLGVMIESNLVEGRQDVGPRDQLVYGQSVTDACIGWEDTAEILKELAEAAAARP